MMVVVVYDIATSDPAGARRLKRVNRVCADFGIAVQNSVFECECSNDEFRSFKKRLAGLIRPELDSIRFYLLGDQYRNRIESIGKEKLIIDRDTYVL